MLLYHLCLGQVAPCFVFTHLIDANDLKKILSELFQHMPPPIYKVTKNSKHYSYYYSIIKDVIQYITNEEIFYDQTIFIMLELKELTRIWSEPLFNALISPKDVPERHYKNVLRGISLLLQHNQSLFEAVRLQIYMLLAKIGPKIYIPFYENEIFGIVDAFDNSFMSLYNIQGLRNIPMNQLWQYPSLLKNAKVGTALQNFIIASEPFPNASTCLKTSNLFTLINDSITRNRHFIDVIFKLAHNTLMAKDLDIVQSLVNILSVFKPWIFLAEYEKISPDPAFFVSVLPIYDAPNAPFDIITRFKNDNELLTFLYRLLGIRIDVHDFETISIPKLIEPLMVKLNNNNIKFMSTSPFFLISDEVRNHDMAFIAAYLILSQIISSIQNPSAYNYEEIEHMLDFLRECSFIDDLMIDIFSVVLMKDEDKALFDFDIAELIISSILPYTREIPEYGKIIFQSFSKMNRIRALGISSFDGCFVSSIGSFVTALDNKDFELADHISQENPKFSVVAKAAQAMHQYVETGELSYDSDLLRLELALSMNETSLVHNTSEIYHSLIINRENLDKEQIVQVIEPLSFFNEILNSADESPNIARFPILADYIQYSKIFSQAISDKSKSIFDSIITSDSLTNWETVEKLIGNNALERILRECDIGKSSPCFIELVKTISPIVGRSISMINNSPFEAVKQKQINMIENSSIGSRLKESNNDLSQIVALFEKAEEVYQSKIPHNILALFLEKSLSIKPVPIDLLVDLRLQDNNLFDFEGMKSRVDYYSLSILFPEKISRLSLELYIENFDITQPSQVVTKLIKQNRFLLAERFSKECNISFTDLLIKHVIEILQSSDNPNLSSLINKASHIYQNLPKEYQAKFIKIIGNNKCFTDDAILQMVKEHVNILSPNELINNYYHSLQNTHEFCEIISNLVHKQISSISVSSNEKEKEAFDILNNAHKTMKSIKAKPFPLLSWLHSFVGKSYYLKFQHSYNVENPETLLSACLIYDELDLLMKAQNVFKDINISEYLEKLVQDCLMLTDISAALDITKMQATLGTKLDDISNLQRLLMHPCPVELRIISSRNHVEMTPMYYRVKCIIMGYGGNLINPEQLKAIEPVYHAFASKKELAKYYSNLRNYKQVFAIIQSSPQVSDLIGCALIPALESENWNNLWKYIKRNSIEIENLLKFLKENNLSNALFDIQIFYGMREDAILTGLDAHFDSWKEEIALYKMLLNQMESEINARKEGKQPEKISDDYLNKFHNLVRLQFKFAEHCLTCDLNFDPKLDLIHNLSSSIEPIAYAALFTHEFDLGMEITRLKIQCFKQIVDRLVVALQCSGKEALSKYLIVMQQHSKSQDLVIAIVTNYAEKIDGNKKRLLEFIQNNILFNELKMKLLLEHGFLSEALVVATKIGDKSLYQEVFSSASRANNQSIMKKCQKLIFT